MFFFILFLTNFDFFLIIISLLFYKFSFFFNFFFIFTKKIINKDYNKDNNKY